MRIAIFTNNYLPSTSGVAVSIENFNNELTRLGHQVFIFAPGYEGQFSDPENVFRFPAVELGKNSFHYRIALPFTPKIDRLVKEGGFDIIHSQHPFWIGQTAMWYAKRIKKPLVFTYHTLYEEYSHYVPVVPQSFLKWYLKKTSLEYALKSKRIIAPSQSVKEMLEKRVKQYLDQEGIIRYQKEDLSIRVVPSGINVEKFQTSDGEEVRSKYGFKENDIVLECVCRMAREKNLEFLLRSLMPTLKNIKNVYLMMVGHGNYIETLAGLAKGMGIENKVRFTGLVPNSEVARYYKAGNIFVYTSTTETQGLVLTEALASGLPVVAVSASGINDVIVDNKNGFLVNNNDENAFKNKVEFLIQNADQCQSFKKAAQETAEEYSVENCTKRLIEVYEEAMKK